MQREIFTLAAACTTFVGSHFVLSHPLRTPLVRRLGERGFLLVYSLIAFAALAWLALAFDRAPAGPALWNGAAPLPWIAASVLTLLALGLFVGSLSRNPALPQVQLAGLSARKPQGAFTITRHPMMMAFALWAVSHILIAPTPRTLLLALAILVLALIGARLQDARKLAANPREWGVWMQRTSFWPKLRRLGALGPLWIVAVLAWLAVTGLHVWLAGIPAGVWGWLV